MPGNRQTTCRILSNKLSRKASLNADIVADPARLAAALKALPLRLIATRPIDEAISTAGGVAFEALDGQLMMRTVPGVFGAGEMLDWEAPTGGVSAYCLLRQWPRRRNRRARLARQPGPAEREFPNGNMSAARPAPHLNQAMNYILSVRSIWYCVGTDSCCRASQYQYFRGSPGR